MELELALNNNLELNKEVTPKEQNSFLESTLGKTLNLAADVGIRLALPDVAEDIVIEAKDIILENGLKEGFSKVINSVIDAGRTLLGIKDKNMKDTDEIKEITERGELIDKTSKLIDSVLKEVGANKMLSNNIIKQIKNGKNAILDSIEKDIDKTVKNQKEGVKEVKSYIKEWDKFFKEKNLEKLNETYEKLTNKAKEILPLEEIVNKIKEITNLNELVNNKGSFEITKEEKELAKKLG